MQTLSGFGGIPRMLHLVPRLDFVSLGRFSQSDSVRAPSAISHDNSHKEQRAKRGDEITISKRIPRVEP